MLDRIRHAIAQLGWNDASCYLAARALALASRERCTLHKYRFVAQPVAGESLCRQRGRAVEVRRIGAADAVPGLQRDPAVLSARFGQGAVCLVAHVRGEVAGFLWLALGGYDEDEVRACYRPAGAAWDFDVQVFPAFQGSPVFARLWDEANQFLRQRGYGWTCSRISAFNRGSHAAHARMGARTLGSALFLCCGRVQLTLASLRPYCHLSWRVADAPLFQLRPPIS